MKKSCCAQMRILVIACSLVVGVNGGFATDVVAGVPGIEGWVGGVAGDTLNPELRTWASGVVDYSPAPGVLPNTFVDPQIDNDVPTKALGPITATAGGETVSLGDLDAAQISGGILPGSITLSFEHTLHNGEGWDLAVFENAFDFFGTNPVKVFAELAYVEVSSDGINFARFPSTSLTTEGTIYKPDYGSGPLRDFAGIDTDDVHNLAGYHGSLIGTPFDFSEIDGVNGVDADNINYVRLIDIPGGGQFLDSLGHPIIDTWVTTGSGGLDLDAVAGRYAVPEPSSIFLLLMGIVGLGIRRRHSR